MSVRVGTSGWSYPGGRGTWNGVFYPSKGARSRGFDELEFYARWFDVVEVNSTFYGQPRPQVTAKWAERTPPGFEFAVKLYQKFTHPTMFRQAATTAAPEADSAWLDQAGVVRQADVDEFRAGIAPLADAGKLGPLLVQFPPSFTASPEAIDYLGWLLRTLGGLLIGRRAAPPVVERSGAGHGRSARRLRGRVGADRRAEVRVLGPAALGAASSAGRAGRGAG